LKELYIEEKTVFKLQELEKLAPKRKGIISQSVKETNQTLIDEDIASTDKIGIGCFYWMFPSQQLNKRQLKVEKLEKSISNVDTKISEIQTKLTGMKRNRESGDDRQDSLKRLKELEELNAKQTESLKDFAELDPERLSEMRKATKIALEAANRWGDNVETIVSFITNKFGKPASYLQ